MNPFRILNPIQNRKVDGRVFHFEITIYYLRVTIRKP